MRFRLWDAVVVFAGPSIFLAVCSPKASIAVSDKNAVIKWASTRLS